jgi:hypothetical protein
MKYFSFVSNKRSFTVTCNEKYISKNNETIYYGF